MQVRDSAFKEVDTEFDLLDSNTLVIKPKENYKQRSVYSIYVSPNVKSAKGTQITEPIFYSFKTKDFTPTVSFKNEYLEETIREKLDKHYNQRISEGDMEELISLSIWNVDNFTGLEKAVNLKVLDIAYLENSVLLANKSIILNLPSLEKVAMSEEQDRSLKKALEDKGIEVFEY